MSRILNGSRFLLGDILALDGCLRLMQANRLMNRTLRYLLFFFCGVVACLCEIFSLKTVVVKVARPFSGSRYMKLPNDRWSGLAAGARDGCSCSQLRRFSRGFLFQILHKGGRP